MRPRPWIVAAVLLSSFAAGEAGDSVLLVGNVGDREAGLQGEVSSESHEVRWSCSEAEQLEYPGNAMRADSEASWIRGLGFCTNASMVQGITWNPDTPKDRFNGPVSYNDRSNDYQLHHFYLFAERSASRNDERPGVGGRVDWLFGSNSRYLLARGLDDQWRISQLYGFAMPQLFAEFYLPIAQGVSVKAGKFYGLIGYASDRALERFFYSFANISYAEPATHTGLLASCKLDQSWTVRAGFTRGWDNWEDNNDKLAVTGALDWKSSDEKSSVVFAFHSGPEDNAGQHNRFAYSVVLQRQLNQRLTWVLHHDLFLEDDGAESPVGTPQDAEGYGLRTQLIYEVSRALGIGIRLEWFRDDDGVIVTQFNSGVNPGAGSYYSLTFSVDWKIGEHLTLRPEARWDWSSGGILPFDNFSDSEQFLFGLQAIHQLW